VQARRWGNDRREVQRLAAFLAGDAVFDTFARDWVHADLTRMGVPPEAIRVIVAAKSAATVGLLVGLRRRPLGLLTSVCLVLYFTLAVGAHARAKDEPWRWVAAATMLAWCTRILRGFQVGDLRPT
jgi:DoxX-like family